MAHTTMILTPPIDPYSLGDHPALHFYVKYTAAFVNELMTVDPENFYNKHCKFYTVDDSMIEGSAAIWKFYQKIYGPFKQSGEYQSIILRSNEQANVFHLHVQEIRVLSFKDGKPPVKIPQVFVYTIGKADEGKGTDCLQVTELRNYYDSSLFEKALGQV